MTPGQKEWNALILRVAGDGVLNPADVRGYASDDRLSTAWPTEAADADDGPAVQLVLARKRTSTVTLHTAHV